MSPQTGTRSVQPLTATGDKGTSFERAGATMQLQPEIVETNRQNAVYDSSEMESKFSVG